MDRADLKDHVRTLATLRETDTLVATCYFGVARGPAHQAQQALPSRPGGGKPGSVLSRLGGVEVSCGSVWWPTCRPSLR